jgi:hypothetical protein
MLNLCFGLLHLMLLQEMKLFILAVLATSIMSAALAILTALAGVVRIIE